MGFLNLEKLRPNQIRRCKKVLGSLLKVVRTNDIQKVVTTIREFIEKNGHGEEANKMIRDANNRKKDGNGGGAAGSSAGKSAKTRSSISDVEEEV